MKAFIVGLLITITPVAASADKNWNKGKGATWDCTKDPVVNINHGGGVYIFKGACTTVNVNGGGIKITADSVETLNVSGAKNTVTVAKVSAINATGTKNTITWKAAISGDAPTVNSVGRDNVIGKAGGAAPAAPAAPPTTAADEPAPPPTGSAIDCSKTATFSIDENHGSYTFTGKCDVIAVAGNHNTLKVESAKAIAVAGNHNKVDAIAVDKLATPGNHNIATWKKGVSGAKAKISNPGNHNSVKQTK